MAKKNDLLTAEALDYMQSRFAPGEKVFHIEHCRAYAPLADKGQDVYMAFIYILSAVLMILTISLLFSSGSTLLKVIFLPLLIFIAIMPIYLLFDTLRARFSKCPVALAFTGKAVYVIDESKRAPIETVCYPDIDRRIKLDNKAIRFVFEPRDESESKALKKSYKSCVKAMKTEGNGAEYRVVQLRYAPVILRTRRGFKVEVLYMMRSFGVENGYELAKKILELERRVRANDGGFPFVSPPDDMIIEEE